MCSSAKREIFSSSNIYRSYSECFLSCLDTMRRTPFRSSLFIISLSVICLSLVFLINNSTNSTSSSLEVQSTECNGLSKQEVIPTEISSASDANIFKPCEQVEKTSPVQRAIIIYYPHHQSDYFFPEVRWYV